MLNKLLKYENRAVWPWYGVAFGICLLLGLLTRLTIEAAIAQYPTASASDSTIVELAFTLSILAAVGCGALLLLMIAGQNLLTTYLPAYRFYRNLLGDEGYLMFTLPVTPGKLLSAKLLSALGGSYVSVLVSIASIAIVLVGLPGSGPVWSEISGAFRFLFADLGGAQLGMVIATAILFVLIILTSPLCTFGLFYLSFMIGQRAHKNRFIWSVVAYFAIYTAIQLVTQIGQLLLELLLVLIMGERLDIQTIYLLYAIVGFVYTVTLSVSTLSVSHHMMKHHLNLE